MATREAIAEQLMKCPKPLVYPVNPFRLNDRLAIQQGLFLFPGDISRPFEEHLSAAQYHKKSRENLIRFAIKGDQKFRKEALLALHRMNMNRATLYPGLEGFATSLKILVALHEEILR